MFEMAVIEVPTNLPNIRIDLPIQAFAVGLMITIQTLFIFLSIILYFVIKCLTFFEQCLQTARGKWEYVREEAEDMSPLGQPVLVGTTR